MLGIYAPIVILFALALGFAVFSIAQQASPNVAGQTEFLRASPTACSTVVSRKPLGSFSSMPMSAHSQSSPPRRHT